MTESSETAAFIIVLITVKVKELNASTSMRDVTKGLDDGRVDRVLVLGLEKTY